MLIALIIIIILLAAVMIGLYAAYHRVFYSPTKEMSETVGPDVVTKHPYSDIAKQKIQQLSDRPCQFVHTRAFDGLRLSARFYEGEEGKPLCLCFHGYKGSALRDYSGIGTFLIREGYNVIIVDERAHWRSQGHTISFGINERKDVLSWLQYTKRRFSENIPIYIFGISMGGGTVLMASGLELPENVKGIVADCPFSSPKDIIKHVCRMVKLNPELCWPAVWLSAHVYGRFNINATTAAKSVLNADKPILIVHGEADNFVPMSMSREIKDARPELIDYQTFPEAGHGLSYYYDTERYERMINDFIAKCSEETSAEQ